MTLTTRMTTGMRLMFEDREWRVEMGPDVLDGKITLHTPGQPPRVIAISLVIAAPTFRLLTETALAPYAAHFERLPQEAKLEALRREEHVREVMTGYRAGRPHPDRPEEPLPAYDLRVTPLLKDRVETKAAELGVNVRQIERWLKSYRDAGLHVYSLIDHRSTRTSNRLGEQAPALGDAILRVARDLENGSDVTFVRIRELVENHLEALAAKGLIKTVKMPHTHSD